MADYYLGTVREVLDPDLYKILIDLPGLSREAEAFPMRGELDEPRPGDQVLVRDIDPIYHSFYLYSKLKDDNFIGFRSRGKLIQITEDEINISIFDPSESYEEKEGEVPQEIKAFIKIRESGNIEVSNIDSDNGDLCIDIKGNSNITVKGSTTLNCPDVTIEGGRLKVDGNVTPNSSTGPFCAIPICPLTGAPHRGPLVIGT